MAFNTPYLSSSMETNSEIFKYFHGMTIFITGATGFLAKIFLEKILRVQPNIKKIFLLIRPTPNKSIEQRLHEEILSTDLFRVFRQKFSPEDLNTVLAKVIPISGDISQDNLGIVDSEMREEMWQEIDILVNTAATTKFDERYDVALGINALGAINVENLATKCSKLATLLHVSTAYVHGNGVGLLLEKAFRVGETLDGAKLPTLDVDVEVMVVKEKLSELRAQNATEKEITIALRNLGIERAVLHGWPNTYVFTKAMGEMLLEKFTQRANLIILRPTVITSTYAEPFPGWIEGLRTLDSIFAAYGKGKIRFFAGDPESILDVIPADMVVNCMIAAAAAARFEHDSRLFVYQVGSSNCNPLKLAEIKRLMHTFLSENPLLDDDKKHFVKVDELSLLHPMCRFDAHISTRYLPFLKALELSNVIFCKLFESAFNKGRGRVNYAMRLAHIYQPYVFFHGIFDDTSTKNLQAKIRSDPGIGMLNFDPKCIRWDNYFVNVHFPGITKYSLK